MNNNPDVYGLVKEMKLNDNQVSSLITSSRPYVNFIAFDGKMSYTIPEACIFSSYNVLRAALTVQGHEFIENTLRHIELSDLAKQSLLAATEGLKIAKETKVIAIESKIWTRRNTIWLIVNICTQDTKTLNT